MRIRLFDDRISALADDPRIAAQLGGKARRAAAGINEPSSMEKSTRSGVGPQGAYAQIVVYGDGAVAWEWGSVNNPPAGQLRAALRRVR